MDVNKSLSNTWLRSAVLGCLWASSEIVLGSFLHNLRVPFASNFLTGIGIILLISVGYQWKDKGLFWRSGWICAMMKAVSPSAVILGPMIAIFCEALLFELAVRLFGRNMFAFICGGMLAMTWTFFHKIASYLIFYGLHMIDLYKNLAIFAQKQLHFTFSSLWEPLIILWSVYLFMGLVSAVFGIYIGRRLLKTSLSMQRIKTRENAVFKNRNEIYTPTSLVWLLGNITAMVLILLLINYSYWYIWCPSGIAIFAIWIWKYKKALRPLKKPKFWIVCCSKQHGLFYRVGE